MDHAYVVVAGSQHRPVIGGTATGAFGNRSAWMSKAAAHSFHSDRVANGESFPDEFVARVPMRILEAGRAAYCAASFWS